VSLARLYLNKNGRCNMKKKTKKAKRNKHVQFRVRTGVKSGLNYPYCNCDRDCEPGEYCKPVPFQDYGICWDLDTYP